MIGKNDSSVSVDLLSIIKLTKLMHSVKRNIKMIQDNFEKRHIGPREADTDDMLKVVGADSLDQLIDEIIPTDIRLPKPLNLEKGMSEYEFLNHMRNLAKKNRVLQSHV